MGRPNYTNRKIEDIKLGQAVAKDLVKRISPGLGSKAAIRDPVVELDITGKSLTNEGFAEIAAALVTSIEYTGEHGRLVKLEELCLRDNKLDIFSLPSLGHVITLSAQDLRDLDLSNNLIEVNTDEEAQVFENFLRCFADCCVLRRLDISGNALGPKAFEVLTRVYGQEEPVDIVAIESECENRNENERNHPDTLGRRVKNLSVSSDPDEHTGEADNTHLGQTSIAQERSRKERKTPNKTAQSTSQNENLRLYQTTKGLRSVPYIVVSKTNMTETCALHLSYVVSLHATSELLLQRVPPARAGAQAQQLMSYDTETKCDGIIYYPNANLGSTGTKTLQLAEIMRKGVLDDMNVCSGVTSQVSTPASKSGSLRRTSDRFSSPIVACSRRRSGTVGTGHDHEDSEKSVAYELERLRHRIQGNILRDVGASSNDLWRMSLKMLCASRALCPRTMDELQTAMNGTAHSEPNVEEAPEVTIASTDSSLFATPIATPVPKTRPLAHRNPNQPLTLRLGQEWRNGKLVLTPIAPSPRSPVFPTVPTSPTPPPPSPPPPESPMIAKVPYRTKLPCGFPTDTWRRILAYAIDAHRTMSIEQQVAMISWATDRRTLFQEIESLGKPRSAQIWKVLEATGCLAYGMKL